MKKTQQIFSFKNIPQFSVLKAVLYFCNLAAVTIYVCLRIIFSGFKISFAEDATNLLQAIVIASSMAVLSYIVFTASVHLRRSWKENKFRTAIPQSIGIAAVTLLIAFTIFGCSAGSSLGVKKDFNTGLTATYTNMEPEEVMLVMNGETLTHTDIPLGESFMLANKNIKGLVVKDGKISVGCALNISGKDGNVILEESDLLKGNDVFDQSSASLLKCTVSTGEPMQREEIYDVHVTFRDKYGDGKIENNVSIRMIGLP